MWYPLDKACTARRTRVYRTVCLEDVGKDKEVKKSTCAYRGESCDGSDDIRALVHHNHGTCAETRLCVFEGVIIHTEEIN
jgi:hypothetical protein